MSVRMIKIGAKSLTLEEWLRRARRPRRTFYNLLARGFSERDALFAPLVDHRAGNSFARKHGAVGTPEYKAWDSMKERCRNPKNSNFANYGGRGIRVCEAWLQSFEAFLSSVGPRPSPSHSLGRIDDDGPYEPGNVRWETPEQQQGNTRNNRVIEAFGKRMILSDWSREAGVPLDTLWRRLSKLQWSAEQALSKPVRPMKKFRRI